MILLRARLSARSAANGQAVLLSLGNSEIAFDLEDVRLTALMMPIGEGSHRAHSGIPEYGPNHLPVSMQ
jgi:hypothetical protein